MANNYTDHPDSSFIVNALSRIKQRDIDTFLINSQPQSKEYAELEAMLAETTMVVFAFLYDCSICRLLLRPASTMILRPRKFKHFRLKRRNIAVGSSRAFSARRLPVAGV